MKWKSYEKNFTFERFRIDQRGPWFWVIANDIPRSPWERCNFISDKTKCSFFNANRSVSVRCVGVKKLHFEAASELCFPKWLNSYFWSFRHQMAECIRSRNLPLWKALVANYLLLLCATGWSHRIEVRRSLKIKSGWTFFHGASINTESLVLYFPFSSFDFKERYRIWTNGSRKIGYEKTKISNYE